MILRRDLLKCVSDFFILKKTLGIAIFGESFNIYFLIGALLIVSSSALALLQKGEKLVQKTADRIGVID